MQKFEKIYSQMFNENQEVFNTFQSIHDAYTINPILNQNKFNSIGNEILEIIRSYERVLCGKTESGQYGKFSSKLSERFWTQIRKKFPKIDFIGISY